MRKSRLSKARKIDRTFCNWNNGKICSSVGWFKHQGSSLLFSKTPRAYLAHHMEQAVREAFSRKIEVDESYFGGGRKGNRGRGAAGKMPVFGLSKKIISMALRTFGIKPNDMCENSMVYQKVSFICF